MIERRAPSRALRIPLPSGSSDWIASLNQLPVRAPANVVVTPHMTSMTIAPLLPCILRTTQATRAVMISPYPASARHRPKKIAKNGARNTVGSTELGTGMPYRRVTVSNGLTIGGLQISTGTSSPSAGWICERLAALNRPTSDSSLA